MARVLIRYDKKVHECGAINEIFGLETLRIKAEKETERLSRELKQKKDKEEKYREIQSMHDIAIDRKIRNIERIGDGVGQNEKNSNDSYL